MKLMHKEILNCSLLFIVKKYNSLYLYTGLSTLRELKIHLSTINLNEKFCLAHKYLMHWYDISAA